MDLTKDDAKELISSPGLLTCSMVDMIMNSVNIVLIGSLFFHLRTTKMMHRNLRLMMVGFNFCTTSGFQSIFDPTFVKAHVG